MAVYISYIQSSNDVLVQPHGPRDRLRPLDLKRDMRDCGDAAARRIVVQRDRRKGPDRVVGISSLVDKSSSLSSSAAASRCRPWRLRRPRGVRAPGRRARSSAATQWCWGRFELASCCSPGRQRACYGSYVLNNSTQNCPRGRERDALRHFREGGAAARRPLAGPVRPAAGRYI